MRRARSVAVVVARHAATQDGRRGLCVSAFKGTLLLFVLLFTFVAGLGASEQLPAVDALEAQITALREHYRVPGVAVAVIEQGAVVLLRGYGVRASGTAVPVTPGTVFQVASISKPVAALSVLRLADAGLLDLDRPVNEVLERWSLPPSSYPQQEVTPRRLLDHTAGLTPSGYTGYPPDWKLPTLQQALRGEGRGARAVRLTRRPGEAFMYSGGGYTVLQLLVEERAGVSFADFAQRAVLDPLDMRSSSFSPTGALAERLATPHSVYGCTLPVYRFAEQAAAGLYSSAGDMARFLIEHMRGLRDDGVLLGAPQYREMMTPGEGDYGLGWSVTPLPGGERVVAHGGANRGWKAYVAMIPERQSGIAILTNSDRGMSLYRDVANTWFAQQEVAYRTRTPDMPFLYLIDLYQRIALFFGL